MGLFVSRETGLVLARARERGEKLGACDRCVQVRRDGSGWWGVRVRVLRGRVEEMRGLRRGLLLHGNVRVRERLGVLPAALLQGPHRLVWVPEQLLWDSHQVRPVVLVTAVPRHALTFVSHGKSRVL